MNTVIEINNVFRTYQSKASFFAKPENVHVLKGVSLTVDRGQVHGLIGESGCGKSTLARLILGLDNPTGGLIKIEGRDLSTLSRKERAKTIQMILQDPNSSLNPKKTVEEILIDPQKVLALGDPQNWRKNASEILDLVGLPRRVLYASPRELSGGQKQRVAIGRALVVRPRVLVCDEPTSALDVSIQSQILNLLQRLQKELDLTCLMISHNLAVVEHMSDRVAVMRYGQIVEVGPTESVMRAPKHAYTRLLLASVLSPEPGRELPEIPLEE
ncbi:hypothetical protein BFW87_00665 [Pseudomonas fluorescens]|uniref:ABC transporter domain-containing protein n=1 Tax=Pseudomonas fluorescens TaxID=294 RepID=A0A1T2ZA87_PSEFL|nr:ATP-binding cassette domain-containing protein [Pseudomonas fluorescens]OPB00950.1 hypothetical protein BFW87_00665 [Pseudomonas fluorescens]